MLLSFIIPLYNCGRYIITCLDSIFASSLSDENFEVIIIDDGSNDNGVQVCEEFATNHQNIVIIKQINSGASTARNRGIDNANGDYIWFVDADDRILPNFLDKISELLKENKTIDVFCFNHRRIFVNHIDEYYEFSSWNTCTGLEFLNKRTGNYIWNKIYRRKSIGNHRFLDGTKNIEDMYFNVELLLNLPRIQVIPLCGYEYYNINIKSTSRNKNLRNLVKLNQDSLKIFKRIINLRNSCTDFESIDYLEKTIHFGIAGHIFSLFRFYPPRTIKKVIGIYKSLGYYPIKKTYSRRANIFLYLANHEKILIIVQYLLMKIQILRYKK